MKEKDCKIDRSITLDLVLYPAVRCPNLIDCGELRRCFVVSFFLLGVVREFPLVGLGDVTRG
jgi:hypothetical protein